MNSKEIKQGSKKYFKLVQLKSLYEKYKRLVIELEQDSKVQLYKFLKFEKKCILEKRDKLLMLELLDDENVKKYINIEEIVDTYNDENFSDSRIINKSFSGLAKRTKDSNNIYIYMGSYDEDDIICITPNEKMYNLYLDLETQIDKKILLKDVDEFEKNNITIFLTDPNIYHNSNFYDSLFYNCRKEFFELIIKKGQEEAVSEIRKRKVK